VVPAGDDEIREQRNPSPVFSYCQNVHMVKSLLQLPLLDSSKSILSKSNKSSNTEKGVWYINSALSYVYCAQYVHFSMFIKYLDDLDDICQSVHTASGTVSHNAMFNFHFQCIGIHIYMIYIYIYII